MSELIDPAPTGQIEYRTATQVGVSFPDRSIELVVMPYETEAIAECRGRMVREIVSRGAFDGIEGRPGRVKVNRDHDVTRTVGRAVKFHPSRQEGLVAELRIAKTPLGDETLALADEEILDASAGFLPMRGGETWEEGNQLRRLSRVWLAHVALTPEPAYEGARVLAVRSGGLTAPQEGPSTPLLDQWRAQQLADRYSRLSR